MAELQVRNPEKLAFVTQTTLSMDDTSRVIDALRTRFPAIGGPRKDDICYATQNRQDAVKQLADDCDVVLVVGSPNSSNSNRLRELAERMATPAYLIDGAEDLQKSWFDGVERIGITAGASAPEVLVRGVIQQLQAWARRVPMSWPAAKRTSPSRCRKSCASARSDVLRLQAQCLLSLCAGQAHPTGCRQHHLELADRLACRADM